MKTNLFFVHLYNDYSGSPRVFRDAIDIADECSTINNRRLFTSKDEGFLTDCDVDRSDVFYKRSSNKLVQIIYYLLSQIHLFFSLSISLLTTRFKCKGCDTIVIINTMLPFGAAIASKLFAKKTIYYVHESHLKPYIMKKFLRLIIEITADDVVFVSNYVQKAERFKSTSMTVIYNGLRSDFPCTPITNGRDKFNSKNVIFSGSLKQYKGVNYVIELAGLMPDFNFILALNCTDKDVKDYFGSMDITPNVSILVRPKNLHEIYSNGFAILNLSIPELWTETFGLSILEGMNYGCVAVAPPVGGPVEIVDDSCGLLCNPKNTVEISKFLTDLSNDFVVWKSFSDAARDRAKYFSYDSFRRNFTEFLNHHCKSGD